MMTRRVEGRESRVDSRKSAHQSPLKLLLLDSCPLPLGLPL